MKSRKLGKVRPYLSQIAEPLLPGEPMLAVRRGQHTRGGPAPLDVPVVQEGNDLVEQPGMLAGSSRAQQLQAPTVGSESEHPVMSAPAQEGGASAAGNRNQTARGTRESTTIVRKSPATPAVVQGEVSRRLAGPARSTTSDAHSALSPSEPGQNANLAAREVAASSSIQTTAERNEPIAAGRISAASAAGEIRDAAVVKQATAQHPPAAQAQATLEAIRNIVREEKVAASNARLLEDGFRQWPLETRADRGNPADTVSGSRVHIGTVEVRITSAQPAPVQVAAVAPKPTMERGAPAGARAGAAEPLARGLAWSYGLVQG